MSVHVIIAGGGVGGLCLAQGLRKRGVSTAVYERDNSAESRLQGYRLRIDENGRHALSTCLPGELYDLAHATSNQLYMPRGTTYDHELNELSSWQSDTPLDKAKASTVVNRRTLREILLAGLGDVVHFDREVTGYEQHGDQVEVYFSDGSSALGDALVAADGINSTVRSQRLPQAKVLDTGLRAIYGQMPLTDEALEWIPKGLLGGSRPVLGPRRTTLALGVFQPCQSTTEAAAQLAPYAELEPVHSYFKWTLVAPQESYPVSQDELFTADPYTLHGYAADLTADWHPVIRRLIAESDASVTFPLSIRASVPTPEWEPTNVTVMGDAIHATTPVGGVGANTALRDAALLARNIGQVADGKRPLREAIASFEVDMREYGYHAVRNSLAGAAAIFQTDALVQKGGHS